MKKVLTFTVAATVALTLVTGAAAEFDPKRDYMAEMIQAAIEGDIEKGREAEHLRGLKIAAMGPERIYIPVSFDDLYLLGKIIYAEAGSYWLSDEWKMAVGEVVLNRVASPEFPDTIEDVIFQPGQYYSRGSSYFARLRPNERCVKLALRLLEGERVLNDPSVIFQANFRQGSGVHTALYDPYLGWTYFCFSSRPGLYETVEASACSAA